jgi:8-oxo-dGTP pyrophosphatase MutT (NUDIX family)
VRLKDYINEKEVSAAVVMGDGKKFLIIHPTGWDSNEWEVPKGNINDGENTKQAAIREFYEETGIKINISGLREVGKFLFTYSTDELPPTSSMKCLSLFHPYKHVGDIETTLREVDKWKYITPDEIDNYVREEMRSMIRKAL